jgi:hypothetical protein
MRAAAALDALEEMFTIETDDPRARERPTIPVPRDSGIRLQVERVPGSGATVDIVVCDLRRDPRSEAYAEHDDDDAPSPPPSTSTIRVLK